MKKLEEELGMTPEEAWKIAHPIADKFENVN